MHHHRKQTITCVAAALNFSENHLNPNHVNLFWKHDQKLKVDSLQIAANFLVTFFKIISSNVLVK